MTKGRLLIAVLSLVSALLIIAACTGTSPTAAPQATATSAPTSATSGAQNMTATSGLSGAGSASSEAAAQLSAPGQAMGTIAPAGPGSAPLASETISRAPTVGQAPALAQSSLAPIYPAIQYSASQQVGIWVTGQGEVTASPDLAIINAGVEARDSTVEAARSQAAQAMGRMVQALNARGIKSGDIQTRFFNISPEYVWNNARNRQELVGYIVNNQVTVRTRDIGNVGLIIDELAERGGDLVRIQGVSFTVENTEALESQAREKAVANLRAKAQQFAQLTGVQLGKPIFLSESGGFVPMVESYAFKALGARESVAALEPPTPISGGELTVTITVQGVFSIIE